MTTVTIKDGSFQNQKIEGVTFAMIKDYFPYKQGGGGFYLVDGKTASEGEFPAKPISCLLYTSDAADE